MILGLNGDYILNQSICVMVKCGVLFGVRTIFLSIIKTSFGFKGLNSNTIFDNLLSNTLNPFS
jgi:hypothetical protein